MSDRGAAVHRATHRLAALDGIRGILVVFLLLFHFGVSGLAGAWLTLNVFFVLSGFLIVRLLVQERARTGRIRFVAFYARRARRLFPALALLLVTVVVYGLAFASDAERASLRWDVLATMGYFMNWRLVSQSNQYFVQFTQPSVLQHAWSLSVEEQFYLVIPALVLALMAVLRTRRALIGVLLALAVASAVWMGIVGVGDDFARSHLYYGTDTRAQSLLLGAALGVWTARLGSGGRPEPRSVRQVQLIGGAAMAVTILGFVVTQPQTPLMADGGMFVLSLAAVAWVWAAADERGGPLQRVLAVWPLAALGRISYGAYLWHWPIGLWLQQAMPGAPVWQRVVLGFVLTVGVAALSYQRIEQPIHDRGWRVVVGGALRARTVAAAVVLALLAGAIGIHGGGAATAMADTQLAQQAKIVPLVPGQPKFQKPAKPYTIALYGDSVPYLLVQNFPADRFPGVTAKSLAVPGCDLLDAPFLNPAMNAPDPNDANCTKLKHETPDRLRAAAGQLVVIFPSVLLGFPHRMGGRDRWWGDPQYSDAVARKLDSIVAAVKSSGAQPAIVTQTCRSDRAINLGGFVKTVRDKNPTALAELKSADHVNAFIRGWAAQRDIPLADLDRATCPTGKPRSLPGIPMFGDGIHFSPQFTPSVWAFLIADLGKYRAGAH